MDNFKFDEINVYSVLRDLLRNFWVPVLLVISVYLGIDAYEKLMFTPEYTSKATFAVSTRGSGTSISTLSLSSDMAGVFNEVFQSNVMRDMLSEHMDSEELDARIVPTIIPNTNLMVVSVISSSPEQSFRALSTLIEIYPELSDLMFSNAVLRVIKDPNVPMVPSNRLDMSSTRKVLCLAAAMAGIALVALLSILRGTVQTPAAARRRIDARLLRSVRHEVKNKTLKAVRKKRNIAPLITSPFISRGFREDNQSLCAKLEYHMRKRGQKILLISSAGENEGKSTVTANLALSLAERGKRVVLLDCDFRKPALHKIFETPASEGKDFGFYLTHEDASPEFLHYLRKQNLFLGVNSTGYKYPQRLFTSPKLHSYLQALRSQADYIILDTPPMLVAADAEALASLADVSVLVVREDFMRVTDINDSIDALRAGTADLAGFVMNNCHSLKDLRWSI